jgi:hypothetical protein
VQSSARSITGKAWGLQNGVGNEPLLCYASWALHHLSAQFPHQQAEVSSSPSFIGHPTLTTLPLRPCTPWWAELWSQLHLRGDWFSPGTSPLQGVLEPGGTSVVPDLDKRFLPGMRKCFSHKPLSSLFIPTVVVVSGR